MLPSHGRYDFSPITKRKDYHWPNGARLALYVCLGIEEYVFGEGMVEDLVPGGSKPDLANTSWRDYGNRVGGFRLVDMFEQFQIPLTVLLNTECYGHAPDLIDYARAKECEMVAHGLTNSDTLAEMDESQQFAYIQSVINSMSKMEGKTPAGWCSPWLAHTDITIDIIKELGFLYLLDLAMDDQPVWLKTRTSPLLHVPFSVEINDSSAIVGRLASASDFSTMIIDQFDEMLEASKQQPLVMCVVVHSFISGQPFRLRALRRAMEHIFGHRDDVWLTTSGRIASFIAEQPDLAP